MHLIYPCSPLNSKKVDEAFEEEANAARECGVRVSAFSIDDLASGSVRLPNLSGTGDVLYRGWMITPEEYSRLFKSVADAGGWMVTVPEQYQRCHYLPGWYHQCADLTPKTVFFDYGANFAEAIKILDWDAYFVKDYVKSLTTSRSSIAKTLDEIVEVVQLIEKYRGRIEGGVCVRQFESLQPETEERFFVFDGIAYSRDGSNSRMADGRIPDIVEKLSPRINCPFFSADVVLNSNGEYRLIELGDGQVSDLKKWTPEAFMRIFAGK